MPVTEDIRNHAIIGPALRQGHKEGRQEGRQEVLMLLLTKKFGPLPSWVEPSLSKLSESAFGDLSMALLDATRLEDLFPGQRPKRTRK